MSQSAFVRPSAPTAHVRRDSDARRSSNWRAWLIGRQLATADAPHQTIGKAIGLAVFASDALSSTAYATQEILVILALAGSVAFGYSFPIAIAIVGLLVIVTISYEQTIHAYPGGGGAYIVARDNLGELPAQTAGAALLTDYILTVSVSVSSGVAQLISAFPVLHPHRVAPRGGLMTLMMLINLRGVKEQGGAFAIPTYFFIVTMFIAVGIGLVRYIFGSLGTGGRPRPRSMPAAAWAVPAAARFFQRHGGPDRRRGHLQRHHGFKEPRSRNAGITLIWMSLILGALFLSITFLAGRIGAVPSEEETVISQLARTILTAGARCTWR